MLLTVDVVTASSSVYWNSPQTAEWTRAMVQLHHCRPCSYSLSLSLSSTLLALFTQVQEAEPSPDGVLPYSKLYRAALHECVLGLNTVLDGK